VTQGGRSLAVGRVGLCGIGRETEAKRVPLSAGAVAQLARLIAAAAPPLEQRAVALVDSPRWPSDLDWSAEGVTPRRAHLGGREIDVSLRAIVEQLRAPGGRPGLARLSMFPTPRFDYFGARIMAAACKPHLRAMGRDLFDAALMRDFGALTGGTFTRFMISGFATYRALATLGVETYEGYPDLQFRLWAGRMMLPPKRRRDTALHARRQIVRRMAARLGISCEDRIDTLDRADAAILALSAAAARRDGGIVVVENCAEGRFLVALDRADTRRLTRLDKSQEA
jgi:hypothetical protein